MISGGGYDDDAIMMLWLLLLLMMMMMMWLLLMTMFPRFRAPHRWKMTLSAPLVSTTTLLLGSRTTTDMRLRALLKGMIARILRRGPGGQGVRSSER
jgi:hypothetical protein